MELEQYMLPMTTSLEKLALECTTDVGDSRKRGALLDPRKNIVMSNRFVVGLEQGSRFAQKLTRIAIGQIPMDAEELPTIVITSKDVEAMGLTKQRLTGHMDAVLDEILSYRIKLAAVDRIQREAKLTGINVFAQATIIPGKGAIAVKLNPMLKEHFLGLRENFTQYSLSVALKLPGYASIKLHELLLSRSRKYHTQVIRFHIEDLMAILNYKPSKEGGGSPSNFVNSTVKRAVQNINESTESYVEYKCLTNGRRLQDIRFYVDSSFKSIDEKQEYWRAIQEFRAGEPITSDSFTREDIMQNTLWIEEQLLYGEGELCLEDIPTGPAK